MYDYIIIGGGIVGLSTAWQLQAAQPDKRILLIEKESGYARHQTGHNSGVIHAGVYYAPGSLKAKFCKEGVAATIAFCNKHNIKYEQCGKLLVATNDLEFERMKALYQRCLQNELEVEWLDAAALKQREPNIVGVGALFVPTTGIVNYTQVCNKMAEEFTEMGGEVKLSHTVTAINETADKITVCTRHAGQTVSFDGGFLIACAGLAADRIAKMTGIAIDFQIIPYRGEYYRLPPKHNRIVNHLIYPIPDPDLPFLGVHLTRMIDGSVTVGPNAVQGFKREGYGKLNFSLQDTWQMLTFSGFWKVTAKHFVSGIRETLDSWLKTGYLKRVQKYCPQITVDDLQPYPAGIRAQAVMADGTLVHDFLFADTPRSLHVCNAPSPAATSAIPIGNYICQKVYEHQR
ncbi:L-2-hydroxyglutarate oxidase [Neisseria lisongii]|uniref:L-2-hydroxyglutarate oxidase n=1 Tax=Neisseria lisongii TaxID=2912188 RepID=A0AAW5APB9_9NEIS|nr:L-2-hydroxyglutarate oxidase [Neisseria lisongii]MCF7530349.1 L-2-hydroxyglutarate oxidase [Neisseria lisongii]